MFAKMGYGSAKIDLVLEDNQVVLGEPMKGKFILQGGSVKQEINSLSVDLVITLNIKGREYKKSVTTIPVSGPFTITENESRELPFEYEIPNDLPISCSQVYYELITHLDIEGGVDSKDADRLAIKAPDSFLKLFTALGSLGFRERATSGKFNGYSQEFEFFPTDFLRDQVSEIEFVAAIEDDGIRLLFEVDCKNGYREIEAKDEIFISNEILQDSDKLTAFFKNKILQMTESPHSFQRPEHFHRHSYGSKSGLSGAMGGLAAGLFGGMLINEMMEGMDLDEMGFGDEVEDAFDFGFEDDE
jgi:sporulation-control protein